MEEIATWQHACFVLSIKHTCFRVNFPFNAYFYPNSKGYVVKVGLLLMTSLAMT